MIKTNKPENPISWSLLIENDRIGNILNRNKLTKLHLMIKFYIYLLF